MGIPPVVMGIVLLLLVGVLFMVAAIIYRKEQINIVELERLKRKHEGEKLALSNYANATRQWLAGEVPYIKAYNAYEQYLVVCGYKAIDDENTNDTNGFLDPNAPFIPKIEHS